MYPRKNGSGRWRGCADVLWQCCSVQSIASKKVRVTGADGKIKGPEVTMDMIPKNQ